jgi:Tol biopolymer transport system component/predicted Ser/Thr protein kinase
MALTPGTRLGAYEILDSIGKGGMGEVYRARDTRLGREVAIKVASERFPDRFEREARTIASLNHPNICALYDVGPNYLVMELVQGESPKGPLPLDIVLDYARQIAGALQAAHEKGIVHRDLKPGNIMVRPDGSVKVLDFGLAKTQAGGRAVEDSPTLTMDGTQTGVILGTAHYMAPEQAKGKPVDKRADIWAFGVVVYELLTGRRLFRGESVSEILAGVMKDEPDWKAVPPRVRRMLRACLERDPKRRLHDAADAMLLLDDAAPVEASSRHWLWPAVAAASLAALAAVSAAHFRETPAPREVTRFEIPPPPQQSFGIYLTVSPDGRKVAYTAQSSDGVSRLWVRDLTTLASRMLPGTEIRSGFGSPFWSPDSRFIAFSDGGWLKKVDAAGTSSPQTIMEIRGSIGMGSWSAAGVILFGGRGGGPLGQVSENGGPAPPVTQVARDRQESAHSFPWFLPDGRHFLYFRAASGNPEVQGIYVGSLDAAPEAQSTERLLASSYGAIFAPVPGSSTGHLLFLRDGTLMAQPFDPQKRQLLGAPVPVAERLGSSNVYGFFSASANGVLVYRGGAAPGRQLAWFDAQGRLLSDVGPPAPWLDLSLSSDGKRAAMVRLEAGNIDILTMDLERGVPNRFTFDAGNDQSPVWSPDGTRIAFSGVRGSRRGVFVKASNGTGEEQLLVEGGGAPTSWSRDGYLLYTQETRQGQDIMAVAVESGKPFPFLATPFNERDAQFSPDGKWVAYISDAGGAAQIYLRPFAPPEAGAGSAAGQWQVAQGNNNEPRWRSDGKALTYRTFDGDLMMVDVTLGAEVQIGAPRRLFRTSVASRLEPAPDLQRFLVAVPQGETTPAPITVVLNWDAALPR